MLPHSLPEPADNFLWNVRSLHESGLSFLVGDVIHGRHWGHMLHPGMIRP